MEGSAFSKKYILKIKSEIFKKKKQKNDTGTKNSHVLFLLTDNSSAIKVII